MKAINEKPGVIKFGNAPIRVLLNEGGAVVWLCLNDLLKKLDRGCMMDNGQAMRLCRTSFRIPFKIGGLNRWGVKPYDVHNLLRVVRGENGLIAKVCDKMQEWVNGLPAAGGMETENEPVKPALPVAVAKPMDLEPVMIDYQGNTNTIKTIDGRVYVNATQMAKGFGKHTFIWLNLAPTKELRKALVGQGKSESLESQVIINRGKNSTTWIEKSLATEFARWLSPDFAIWYDERFNELTPKGGEVMTAPKREYCNSFSEAVGNFPVPQNYEEALMLAAQQARKIREDQPKVEFYEEFVEERDNFTSTRVADELSVPTAQLHRFLAENNIIKFEVYRWVVTSSYQALQCDVPYMWQKANGKLYPTGSVKRWTKAGREYIIELWRSKHPELYLKKR